MKQFDGYLNGIGFRIRRPGEDGAPGYRRGTARERLLQQNITDPRIPLWQSRTDVRPFFQSDWSGGARWEKPRMVVENQDTYFTSNGLAAWTRPGFIAPLNQIVQRTPSTPALRPESRAISVKGATYLIGSDVTVSSYDEVHTLPTDVSLDIVGTGFNGGTNGNVWATTYSPSHDSIFSLDSNGNIGYYTVGTPAGGLVTTSTLNPGSNIFITVDGRLMFYNGHITQEITDPLGTPAKSTINNDGLGGDALIQLAWTDSNRILHKGTPRLAVSTPSGIWYVKNVYTNGLTTPFVFRLDRRSDGTFIQESVGTLPSGNLALSCFWHLGQLVVLTVQAFAEMTNDLTQRHPSSIWFINKQGQGAIGQIDGQLAPDFDAYAILGSRDRFLYFGGSETVWVYDAQNGGIHKLVTDETGLGYAYADMTFHYGDTTTGFSGEGPLFLRVSDSASAKLVFRGHERYNDPDTGAVGAVDVDLVVSDEYTLESNYFDFGLPNEDKTIVAVEIETEDMSDAFAQRYVVEIEVDDDFQTKANSSPFVLDHRSGEFTRTSLTGETNFTGKRFRYRIKFETAGAAKPGLRSIKFEAISGDQTRRWAFVVDGKEFRNLENVPVDPDDVFSNWDTLAVRGTPTTLIDNFITRTQDDDDRETVTVQIDQVEIVKAVPGEVAQIMVQLSEIP